MGYFRFCIAAVAALTALAGTAYGQSATKSNLALSNTKPIQIESDKLEIHEQEKRALFDGNVKVVQGTMTLQAAHMIVFYKGNSSGMTSGKGDIDRIEVNGAVSLISGDRSARGEAGTFDMRTELLTLKGKQVVLKDGDNISTGCSLTVQMNTGVAKLDSCGQRVKLLISPKSN